MIYINIDELHQNQVTVIPVAAPCQVVCAFVVEYNLRKETIMKKE